MTKENDKLKIYSTISCLSIVIYALIHIVLSISHGFYFSTNIVQSIILLATVGSLYYKRKDFLAISLIIVSVLEIVSMTANSIIVALSAVLSYEVAALFVYYSNKKMDIIKKVFYIPAILYILYVIIYIINGINLKISFNTAYIISDVFMISGFLFLELWAVNYKTPSKETSGHIPTRNKGTEADRLLKLKELLDSGAITQEEYESKKKQILKL